MKVDKQIIKTQEIDIKITGITLLSVDEYKANKEIIPFTLKWWWLRSNCCDQNRTAIGSYHGSLGHTNVSNAHGCVRPALYIWRPESSGLQRGDKFKLAGHMWTMLSGDLALCDDIVGDTCFRKDSDAEDANDYDKSDIKQWLYNWAEENGIDFMMQVFSPD